MNKVRLLSQAPVGKLALGWMVVSNLAQHGHYSVLVFDAGGAVAAPLPGRRSQMAHDHAHALAQAKEQLLAQRRRLIERFAAGWWPGASENDVDLLVRIDKAIDVVNNLIEGEPELVPNRTSGEYQDILPATANGFATA